jgi:tetratricopeptide (TPR) repeat protein
VLLRREGDLDASAEALERAFELAEQVGRSEVAFQALFWLAGTLRDRGDHADADQTLARALDVCERAGLVAQSLEATAARAVNLALWGKGEQAREVAEEAESLAERLRYPVGRAASLEARGASSADPSERAQLLAEARDAWADLARPLDAERAKALADQVAA